MTPREDLHALSSPDLRDRAVHLAMRRMDIGFLWELLRESQAAGSLRHLYLDYLEKHAS
jgi:hypothetical protein